MILKREFSEKKSVKIPGFFKGAIKAYEGKGEGNVRYSLDIDSFDISQYNVDKTTQDSNKQEVSNERREMGNGNPQGRNKEKLARATSQRLQKNINGNEGNRQKGGVDGRGNSSLFLNRKDSDGRTISQNIAKK